MIDSLAQAVKVEGNRFALASAVAKRSAQLVNGAEPLCIIDKNDNVISTSIKEVAQGSIKIIYDKAGNVP